MSFSYASQVASMSFATVKTADSLCCCQTILNFTLCYFKIACHFTLVVVAYFLLLSVTLSITQDGTALSVSGPLSVKNRKCDKSLFCEFQHSSNIYVTFLYCSMTCAPHMGGLPVIILLSLSSVMARLQSGLTWMVRKSHLCKGEADTLAENRVSSQSGRQYWEGKLIFLLK